MHVRPPFNYKMQKMTTTFGVQLRDMFPSAAIKTTTLFINVRQLQSSIFKKILQLEDIIEQSRDSNCFF